MNTVLGFSLAESLPGKKKNYLLIALVKCERTTKYNIIHFDYYENLFSSNFSISTFVEMLIKVRRDVYWDVKP